MTNQEKIQYLKENGVNIITDESRACSTCGSNEFANDLYLHASNYDLNVGGVAVHCATCLCYGKLDQVIAHSNELKNRMDNEFQPVADVKIVKNETGCGGVAVRMPLLKGEANNSFRREMHELGFQYPTEASQPIWSDMLWHGSDLDQTAKKVEELASRFTLTSTTRTYGK